FAPSPIVHTTRALHVLEHRLCHATTLHPCAPGVPFFLATIRHLHPHLGPARDVLRHPDRLHRHDLVRPLRLLRARDVRRGRGPALDAATEPVARLRLRPRRRGGGGGVRGLLLDPAARHLLLDHHPDILPDLLRHHPHLDR